MPKHEDKPISLHPLTFEEALTRLLKTPPVNPSKHKRKKRKERAGKPKSKPPTGA